MRKTFLALPFLLVSLAAAAGQNTLTVSLEHLIGSRASYRGLDVVLLAREQGTDGVLNDAMCGGGFREVPVPTDGELTIAGVQASADCPRRQEYVLVIGGRQFPFRMPDRDSSLQGILVPSGTELGPCTVSATEPVSPSPGDLWCEPSGAQLAYRAGSVWHPVQGGDGEGGSVTLSTVQGQIRSGVKTTPRRVGGTSRLATCWRRTGTRSRMPSSRSRSMRRPAS